MECSNATRTSSRYIGREQILSNKTAYTLPFYKFFSFRYLCKTIFNLKIVIVSTHCWIVFLSFYLSIFLLESHLSTRNFLPNEFLWDGTPFHHDVKSLDLKYRKLASIFTWNATISNLCICIECFIWENEAVKYVNQCFLVLINLFMSKGICTNAQFMCSLV